MSDEIKLPRYMMGTLAFSGGDKPLDISRDEPDLCVVRRVEGSNYIGEWCSGMGFVKVKFPVDSTRPLTEAEAFHYSGMVADAPWGRWRHPFADLLANPATLNVEPYATPPLHPTVDPEMTQKRMPPSVETET